jgi:hypothetical protein
MRATAAVTRHAIAEGVADVLVPALTGKPRKTRPEASAGPGLSGPALTQAVNLMGARLGGRGSHLTMTGAPGDPRLAS